MNANDITQPVRLDGLYDVLMVPPRRVTSWVDEGVLPSARISLDGGRTYRLYTDQSAVNALRGGTR